MSLFKGKSKYVIIFLLISVITVAAIFFFKPKDNEQVTAEFLNVDEAYADSILDLMTLEDKVAQLVIYTGNEIPPSNLSGYKINADSISDFILSYNKIIDSANVRPFIVNNSQLLLPEFYNNYYNFPSVQNFLSLSDTNLIHSFVDFIFEKDSLLNFDFYLFPLLQNISDSTILDTNVLYFYKNTISVFSKKLANKKIIFSVPVIPFSADSNRRYALSQIYQQLTDDGLNSIFVSDFKQLSYSLCENFSGVIISNPNIFCDFETFLESNVDMLLINDSLTFIYDELYKIANSKKKFEKLLDQKVKKVLLAKTWLNLNTPQNKNLQINFNQFKNINIDVLLRRITKKSLILLKNNNGFLPIKDVNKKTECLVFTKNNNFNTFDEFIKKYNSVKISIFDNQASEYLKNTHISSDNNLIVIIDSIVIDTSFTNKLFSLDTTLNLVVVNISNSDNLQLLGNLSTLIHVNDTSDLSKSYLAQAIYGGIEMDSKISKNINDSIVFRQGIFSEKTRLSYDIPEMVGLDLKYLHKIDSIAQDAIANYVFPGCQVFVAKNGVVVWDKSYGYIDYGKSISVKENTLYDIASVTKIVGTTLATMKMYEQGKIQLDSKLENYFKNTKIDYNRLKRDTTVKDYIVKIDTINILYESNWQKLVRGTDTSWINDTIVVSIDTIKYDVAPRNNIFKVTPRQLLMHKSGIQPAMPILGYMLLDDKKFDRIRDVYNDTLDTMPLSFSQKRDILYTNRFIRDSAEFQVAAGLYLKNIYYDSLWEDTKLLKVWHKKVYVYSDVNMILLQMTIDTINNYSISRYLNNYFYAPLGLDHILYKPLNSFSKNMIAPTERETFWRRQLIWGTVHDPSAACMGGIAGNAGIFSNAYSLGVIGQMLLNGGTYGGRRYLNASTINHFAATQPDSHRGLGFDKWSQNQIVAKDASVNTYGHTGFTGTCVWVDPDNEIVYIFLSNRVHPSARNWKINKYKIRQKIHQTVYDSFK
ncbi:MAG: serine hydrolase [Bacteroidales bacterium]|nr:serine hydrolase [Bacteroidales bacterium]